jgi:hypothetical protein
MVGAKEVLAALNTNPAYADATIEEVLGEGVTDYNRKNSKTMREMGLDLDDVAENAGEELARNIALALIATGSPIGLGCAAFMQGLQVGFQLGRGYVEE